MSMVRISKLVVVLIACVALGGCVFPFMVNTKVTTYYVGEPSLTGKSFAVVPDGAEQENSLEYAAQKQKLESRLVSKGMVVAAPASADYIVRFAYGVDDGKVSVSSSPVYGSTGGGTTNYSGSVYGSGRSANYYGSATTTPQFGVVGSRTVSSRDYTRVITIEVFENKAGVAGKKLYETKATSVGSCNLIEPIIDPMLDAIFQDYPGANGVTRPVTIEIAQFPC